MSAHTAGPWTIDAPYIRSNGGKATVCEVKDGWYMTSGPQYSREEIMGNASLIAAAPELLKALHIAVRQNSNGMQMTGEELRQCEDAIAKATGEQT